VATRFERPSTAVAALVVVTAGFVPTVVAIAHDGWLPSGVVLVFQASLVLSGALLWKSEGAHRHAVLLVLSGVLVGVSNLDNGWSSDSASYLTQIGWTFQWSAAAVLVMVVISYPEVQIHPRSRRVLVGLFWFWAVGLRIVGSLLWDPEENGYTGPSLWFTAYAATGATQVLDEASPWVLGVLVVWLVAVEVKRWRNARGGSRTAVRLVALAGALLAIGQLVRLSWQSSAAYGGHPGVENWIVAVQMSTGIAAAAALLAVAVHASTRRASMIEQLLGAGGDPRLVQGVLGDALGDPTLRLRFVVGSQWVGVDGGPTDPTTADGRITQVLLRDDGEPAAEIDAEDYVLRDPAMLRATLAAASAVLLNARLTAERAANLAEVRASRTRVVEAGIAQRRQLERDLHDGAQQSLLAVSATLSRASLADDAREMRVVVDEARADLTAALAEVRRLARGIHPAALSQGGLVAGLTSLVAGSPNVELLVDDDLLDGRRSSPVVESTAYFVAAEALANAAKHAPSGRVTVTVGTAQNSLVVEISDDGPGGAYLEPGGGLAGLDDRVRAVGGVLSVESAAGHGTTVRACLPDRAET